MLPFAAHRLITHQSLHFAFGIALVVLTFHVEATLGQDERVVKALHGVTPGESTLDTLQGESWSNLIRQDLAADGTEQRFYKIAPWEQVIILSQNQTIVAIDLVPPPQFTVDDIVQAFRLGRLDSIATPPPQATVALDKWQGPLLESSAARVLLTTQEANGKVLVTRLRFFGTEPLKPTLDDQTSPTSTASLTRRTLPFRGITPGITTIAQVVSIPEWGQPVRKISIDQDFDLYRYFRTSPAMDEEAMLSIEATLEEKMQQGSLDLAGRLTLQGMRDARGRQGAELWDYLIEPWSRVSLVVQDDRVWAIDLFPATNVSRHEIEQQFGIQGLIAPTRRTDIEPPLATPPQKEVFDPDDRSPGFWPLGPRRLQIPQGLRVGPVRVPNRLRYLEFRDHRVALFLDHAPLFADGFLDPPTSDANQPSPDLVRVIRFFADVPERYLLVGASIRTIEGEEARRIVPSMKQNRIARVERILDASPAASAGLQVGDVLLRFNEVPVESMEDFRQLVTLSPSNSPSSLEILRGQENLVLQVLPAPQSISSAFSRRAVFYSRANQLERALSDIEVVIALESPVTANSLAQRGDLRRRLGQTEAAISDLNRALEITPKFFWALISRALCYEQIRDFDAAVTDYTTALEIVPNDPQTLMNRGASLFRRGDLEKALVDTNLAIQIDPKNAMAYFNRGIMHERQGDNAAAIADYSRAIELAPKDARPYTQRAALYRKLQDPEKAAADEAQAQRLRAPKPPIPGPSDQ